MTTLQALWRGRGPAAAFAAHRAAKAAALARRLAAAARTVTAAYAAQAAVVESAADVHAFLEIETAALERAEAAEASEFDAQWRAWEQKMERFFATECPLDADWVARADPQARAGTVYVNLRTGRSQEENPNALKAVATRNRQWLKATRAREERLQAHEARAQRVRALRRGKVPELEAMLATPIFL